jgi:hypothetical protein
MDPLLPFLNGLTALVQLVHQLLGGMTAALHGKLLRAAATAAGSRDTVFCAVDSNSGRRRRAPRKSAQRALHSTGT